MGVIRSMWMLVVGACALACDGGGSGGGCPASRACGGDLQGTWAFTGECWSVTAEVQDACAGRRITSNSVRPVGGYTFLAGGRYQLRYGHEGAATVVLPPSCLASRGARLMTCGQISVADADLLALAPSRVSCTGEIATGCTCQATVKTDVATSQGRYAVAGTSVTLTPEVGLPATHAYCVSADALTMQGRVPPANDTWGAALARAP